MADADQSLGMGDLVAELILAGVSYQWLASPEARIPQVLQLASNVSRARVRETQRMCKAVVAAFDSKTQRQLIKEHARPPAPPAPTPEASPTAGRSSPDTAPAAGEAPTGRVGRPRRPRAEQTPAADPLGYVEPIVRPDGGLTIPGSTDLPDFLT